MIRTNIRIRNIRISEYLSHPDLVILVNLVILANLVILVNLVVPKKFQFCFYRTQVNLGSDSWVRLSVTK